jgi:hypothetical protein
MAGDPRDPGVLRMGSRRFSRFVAGISPVVSFRTLWGGLPLDWDERRADSVCGASCGQRTRTKGFLFMKLVLSAVAIASLCAAPVWAQSDKSKNTETHNTRPEPPMLGKHLAKGQSKPDTGAGARVTNLTYHQGPVITAPTIVKPIFWGKSWASSNFTGDKMTGLDDFYAHVGGSSYLGTNTEYTQSSGAFVTTTVTGQTHVVDSTTAGPSGAPATSAVLAEVCKMITTPASNGYYPVYVDTPRGNTGYCAWHSWGKCGNTNIQFAFFFNLDGDSGCDPEDTLTTHTQGLAALANVSGHELSERMTDPLGNAWYDQKGAENSDKCAWKFGLNTVQLAPNSFWKIQGNWSNAAYSANQGYVDHTFYSGTKERGCIDGTNPK